MTKPAKYACVYFSSTIFVSLPSISSLGQIFEGNTNYDTPELRTVEPLLTRFIRVYPERATPAGMGLRLEFLGCEIEGKLELYFYVQCWGKLL